MIKRISITATTFAAFILAMIGLFPVIATAQAPGEPQEGAINTSRSNIKNTSKWSGDVMVVLNEVSGKNAASCRLTNTNNNRKVSGGESVFDCGVPAEGDYVLTVRIGEAIIDDLNGLIRRVTLTGPVGGPIEKDWKLEAKASEPTNARNSSGGLSSDFGQFKIPFQADGKTRIAGKITLPNGGVVIKNIRKPN